MSRTRCTYGRPQWIWSGMAIAAAGMILAAGCSRGRDAKGTRAAQAIEVKMAAPRYQSVQRSVDVVGTIYGQEEITISAKVPGRMESILKDIGDSLYPTEPLAQIEQTDYRLGRDQKGLAIRETLAKLGLTELPKGTFDVTVVATVQKARLQADNAEARYNRGKKLHEQVPPLLSDQDFADLKTTWEVARSSYQVEILTAQAILADAFAKKADLDLAEQRLSDTTVCAPTPAPVPHPPTTAKTPTFYVVARMVSVGEYVKEGTALYRIVDDNLVKLRAAVPERHASRLKIGQTVRVRVEAYRDEFIGRISRINPQVDMANRTFQIEVLIPNEKRLLKSGSFARASVLTETDANVLFVPADAVFTFAGESKVFRVKDMKDAGPRSEGTAVQFSVEIGERQGDYVEITKGLSGLEPVVTTGVSKLAMGMPVALVREKRPASGPASGRAGSVAGIP